MLFRKLWLSRRSHNKNARGRHVRLGSFASIPTASQPVPFSAVVRGCYRYLIGCRAKPFSGPEETGMKTGSAFTRTNSKGASR